MNLAEICRMVARSLIAEIGPWGNQCVLFGGLIPGLLVPDPGERAAPHIGTGDVDVAIRVAAIGDEEAMYRTLKNNLAALDLKQTGDRSFEWKRFVEGVEVMVELFVPVDKPGEGGNLQKKPIEKGGSGLTALGIYGLDLIDRDLVVIEDEGPLLDNRGNKRVNLRVCGPAMLIALKAWALHDRTKPKDGYDIVWILKAAEPNVVAKRFVDAKLHETEFGKQALEYLAQNFESPGHTGPLGWIEESHFQGDERARETRGAVGIVKEFLTLVNSLIEQL